MATYIYIACYRTFPSLPFEFTLTERSKYEVRIMAYLFIFVHLCISYLIMFGANTVPGSMRHWISVKLIVKEEDEEKYGGKRE